MKTLNDIFETVKQVNEQNNVDTDRLVLNTSMTNIQILNASKNLDKSIVLEFELSL